MHLRKTASFLLCVLIFGQMVRADDAKKITGFAPVTISSANYRTTPPAQLEEVIEGKAVVNPEGRPQKPVGETTLYIFLPGEIYENDLSYEQVCALTEKSLLKNGFVNGADALGIIREPKKVKLVLRLSYGVRSWRRPVVRTQQLAWKDGLDPKPKGRGLLTLGGEVAYSDRAGGNDEALAAAGSNASNPNSFWGSGGAGAGGGIPGNTTSTGSAIQSSNLSTPAGIATEFGSTRDYNLIVVDAFDYAELKKDGKQATRLWSTFLAAPVQRDQPFSAVLGTMLKMADGYWGETSGGLQVFNDSRAEVKIGELEVLPDP